MYNSQTQPLENVCSCRHRKSSILSGTSDGEHRPRMNFGYPKHAGAGCSRIETNYGYMMTGQPDTEPPDSVVFFDGVCGLCNHTINLLLNLDRKHRLRFAPLQGTTAQNCVPAEARTEMKSFVFSRDGHLYYRSAALVRILIRLGGIYAVLGSILWIIPGPLRDIAYRVVSACRYRVFGKHDSCRLPTPAERAKFLD